jgi:hypothetical protein
MGLVVTKRRSGANGGSGLVDTLDEGFLLRYKVGDTVSTEVSNNIPDVVTLGPDAGHSAVGYADRVAGDPSDFTEVQWRGFWRFDLTGIDLANITRAILSWEVMDITAYVGYENDLLDLKIEAGYNVTGDALDGSDWNAVYPYALGTLHKIHWVAEGWKDWDLQNLEVLRDGVGLSPRFDVRLYLTNYVAEDTGVRVDFASGDNDKTQAPRLTITTESRGVILRIPAFVRSLVHSARISKIETEAACISSPVRSAAIRTVDTVPASLCSPVRSVALRRIGEV